jgi:hypothetical protein
MRVNDTHTLRWMSDACLEAAMSHVLKHGVTSIHHMAYTWNDIAVFKRFGSTRYGLSTHQGESAWSAKLTV